MEQNEGNLEYKTWIQSAQTDCIENLRQVNI